jgi:hypothetical protein
LNAADREALSLRLTHEAFSLNRNDLEREYFDRFASVCQDQGAESHASGSVRPLWD